MLLDADGSRRKRVLIKVGPKLFGLLDERRGGVGVASVRRRGNDPDCRRRNITEPSIC